MVRIFFSVTRLAWMREKHPFSWVSCTEAKSIISPSQAPWAETAFTGPLMNMARSMSWIIRSVITSTSVMRAETLLVRVKSILITRSDFSNTRLRT